MHIALPVVILCGFRASMAALYRSGKAALDRLAVWEFLIPTLAFLGTATMAPGTLAPDSDNRIYPYCPRLGRERSRFVPFVASLGEIHADWDL